MCRVSSLIHNILPSILVHFKLLKMSLPIHRAVPRVGAAAGVVLSLCPDHMLYC